MFRVKRKRRIFACLLALCLLLAAAVFGADAYIKTFSRSKILSEEETVLSAEGADCILVLGCAVYSDGTPCPMLYDRLMQGIALYKAGAAPKLLMSGDHGAADYDEVNVMKQFAVDQGVPSEDIFMDHAGFSTYESVYRAKEIFDVDKMIIVTQEYHLYRAIYDAEMLGMEAIGTASDPRPYAGQTYRDLREILARDKDFLYCVFKPEPKFLGDVIPISGNGNSTNDS